MFACLSLAVKFSDVNLLKSWVVKYLKILYYSHIFFDLVLFSTAVRAVVVVVVVVANLVILGIFSNFIHFSIKSNSSS